MSERLPGGHIETFGLFCGDDQIGFQCFANYVPWRDKVNTREKMHSNRTVVHPDYVGLGLGIRVINVTSEYMTREGYDVRAKFSSVPVFRAMERQSCWQFQDEQRPIGKTRVGGNMNRQTSFRENVRVFAFRYIGGIELDEYA